MKYRPVRIERLKAGMIVAEPVLSDAGRVILDKGVVLTGDIIRYLQGSRIFYVYIALAEKSHFAKPALHTLYKETVEIIGQTFEKVRLFQEVPVHECKELVKDHIEVMINLSGVVDSLYRVKRHSEYAYRHSLNVSIIAGILGKWLGFMGQDLQDIMLAGLLHDIGKARIPKKILDKPDKLTDQEMDIMRKHSLYGYELIARSEEISLAVKLGVLQHHERNDASGYPLALHCADITQYGKIVAVADTYDALTSERVYRRKMLPFMAVETMLGKMYGQLDPQLCLTFMTNLCQHLIGSLVKLSDGNTARVVLLNDVLASRPVVQLGNGVSIDLEKRRDITIVAVLDEVVINPGSEAAPRTK